MVNQATPLDPETRQEWEALFAEYFPDGVLVTPLGPDEVENANSPQIVSEGAYIVQMNDEEEGENYPTIQIEDVFTGYQLRFDVDDVEVKTEGESIRLHTFADFTYVLSNQLMESQRAYIAARREHGW